MAAAKKAKGLRVTAPLVQVNVSDRAVQFYAGDVLPDGVSDESVKHLKDLGYVEDTDVAPEPDQA